MNRSAINLRTKASIRHVSKASIRRVSKALHFPTELFPGKPKSFKNVETREGEKIVSSKWIKAFPSWHWQISLLSLKRRFSIFSFLSPFSLSSRSFIQFNEPISFLFLCVQLYDVDERRAGIGHVRKHFLSKRLLQCFSLPFPPGLFCRTSMECERGLRSEEEERELFWEKGR